MFRHLRTGAAALTLGLLTACGGAGAGGTAGVIEYWLWDSGQQPGYQKCADAFQRQNPGLRINISQYGWDTYWTKLTAGFIADTAPDVFTDHLAKFAQYVDLEVLRPLDGLAPTSDIDDNDYQQGLAQLWKGQDGKRYGSPKDWDTVAVFYDRAALRDAGTDPAELGNLTWNPRDGGTFERLVAHLTIDANGVRGDEPGFDKDHVRIHGLASEGAGGGGWGQTQWSAFTGSAGWKVTDKNPWGTRFNLDQPAFQDTLTWYFGLARKGYMPTYAEIGGSNAIGTDKQIQSGIAAMGISGSWMISTFSKLTDAAGKKLDIGIAPTPIGPSGARASMFNGLADSVTTLSKQPENAAKWVKFMSGAECQKIIGESGVVFPARPEATELAIAFNKKERGLDVTPFTDQVTDKTTFLFPVTTNAADITALMAPRLDAVYIGSEPVSSLTRLNDQLNDLFKVAQ
ncbi:ABC transporter substrate-binding protein [Amorphoplanes digitatis]|uniref:Multiple sugar transport system substrate-binding protein n=1 Tax=Actinoplanes digitatis TaxID=1868 RepID=A0A7W7MP87_9ACTN|nr:sugar ABC transporter substrate-binding protein [Actinoplanes digitatis]MBB4761856.1 multiple sugar transport system substrate-binding protein [Actinoplanes digitatis]BFE70533.1 sugar ABC transporter substrate-binding protein [Actinoplanes digitatis]GID90967.1 sugar ABC transporter substrate-binding protein [Actinoplanes digitatis]